MLEQMNLSSVAALPPPSGIQSNFDNPVTRAFETHVSMGICLGITLVFVLLRCYVRIALNKCWGWDDSFCLIAFFTITGFCIVTFTLSGPGKWLGVHMWDIPITHFTKSFFQRFITSFNLYALSALSAKLSIFSLYLRLFKPNRLTRYLNYIGIALCLIFYTTTIIINCALCIPPSDDTDLSWSIRISYCGPYIYNAAIAQSAFGTLSDVYLLVIPIRMIFSLRLPMEKKLGVSAIFLIGLLAIACSIANLVYRVTIFNNTPDFLWPTTTLYILSSAEICAGIICGSTPVLVTLFRPKKTSTYPTTGNRYSRSKFTTSASNGERRFLEVETASEEGLRGAMGNGNAKSELGEVVNEEWVEIENGRRESEGN